jgi:ATP-binding cassette subfamily C (CFTR/MRP) protein 4
MGRTFQLGKANFFFSQKNLSARQLIYLARAI